MDIRRHWEREATSVCTWGILCLLPVFFGLGCSAMTYKRQETCARAAYFASPQEAVPLITELLRAQDYARLARYYDLSGTDIPRAELISGTFFVRRERPEMAHPGGFWRTKHPFPPGFTYRSMQPEAAENVFAVVVEIRIDQGVAHPSQVGYSQFQMITSKKGWQILPPSKETRHP